MHVEGTAGQTAALFDALRKAQAEFPVIPKTKAAYNYKYAPMDEIEEKIRPVLIKHELAVFHPLNHVNGKQAVGTLIVHVEGGRFWCDGLIIQEGIKITDQGSHITYGRRYGYCAMLGITSQDEDDTVIAAKSPRRSTTSRRDGVAQDGRAPAAGTTVPTSPRGDFGSIPDPSLPTKTERTQYVAKLGQYRKQVTDEALQRFLLRESGASEVRLIAKKDWIRLLAILDEALSQGHLLEAVSANFNR
jgi:hypothetical protein